MRLPARGVPAKTPRPRLEETAAAWCGSLSAQRGQVTGQVALRGQVPQPRRGQSRQVLKIEAAAGRRPLRDAEQVRERDRLLIGNRFVIVAQPSGLAGLGDGFLQVAD